MATDVRVGIGFDVHRLADGRPMVLAGVRVDAPRGPLGHSDADAVLHAVADAVLGAAGLGDLGEHFPDTDPAYRDADSAVLLERVAALAHEAGWRVANADINVILERPKLGPRKAAMRKRVAALLGIAPEAVGLKARTAEGLGPVGAGEAVAAQAVVLLERADGA